MAIPYRYKDTPVYLATNETDFVTFVNFRRTTKEEVVGSTRHTVKGKETFQDIALKYYSAPEYWFVLADMNPQIFDPNDLTDGDIIIVPPPSYVYLL